MTTASVTLTHEQMSNLLLTLQWSASPMIEAQRVVAPMVGARRELVQLLAPFDGEVTITGPIHVSGVEAEKVTVRNTAVKRDCCGSEHDDLTRLTMAASKVIGDRRDLIELDAMAGTSGEAFRGTARQDGARQAWLCEAMRGLAKRGEAGEVGQGTAGQHGTWLGEAGGARRGLALRGMDGRGRQGKGPITTKEGATSENLWNSCRAGLVA